MRRFVTVEEPFNSSVRTQLAGRLTPTPTAPSAAFPLNEKQDDPIKMYLNDVFTVPASLAGIPGISIPYGHDKEGLPLGIQLLGKHYNEQEIFNAAFALEKDYE